MKKVFFTDGTELELDVSSVGIGRYAEILRMYDRNTEEIIADFVIRHLKAIIYDGDLEVKLERTKWEDE